jgi:hypothetical protein
MFQAITVTVNAVQRLSTRIMTRDLKLHKTELHTESGVHNIVFLC